MTPESDVEFHGCPMQAGDMVWLPISPSARLQMRVALKEWHSRIPDYWLGDDDVILEHGGQLGLERLPIAWAPERKGMPRM